MEKLLPFKIKLDRPAAKVPPVGAGAFGKVFEVSYNGTPCIAKSLHNILMGQGLYEAVASEQTKPLSSKFVNECLLHSTFRHPNVVQFIGVEYGDDPKNFDLHLVMERMDMSLESCLEVFPNIPIAIKLSVLRDVSAGLLYLHSFNPPIIHGDLTTTNILLTQDWKAKIADFGNSVDENFLSTVPGALAYMPPEAFQKPLKYDSKLDVFSFGTVSLFTGVQAKACDYGNRDELIQRLRDDQQLNCICQIVTWCCEEDQRKRPTSLELNTWLQELCPHNTEKLNREPYEVLKMKYELQDILISQYEEDLKRERAERILAVQGRINIEKELQACKKAIENQIKVPKKQKRKTATSVEENDQLKKINDDLKDQLSSTEDNLVSKQKELDAVKANLEAMEDIVHKQLKNLNVELSEAREEIAVKVAQVKQYQKQVEAYKQQVGVLHTKTQEAEREAKDASDTLIIELIDSQPHCQLPQSGPLPTSPPPPPSTHTSNLASCSDMQVPQKETIRPALCAPDAPPLVPVEPVHSEEHTKTPPLLQTMPHPKGSNEDGTTSSPAQMGEATRAPPSSGTLQRGSDRDSVEVDDLPPPIFHHHHHFQQPVLARAAVHSGQGPTCPPSQPTCPPSQLGTLELHDVRHVIPPSCKRAVSLPSGDLPSPMSNPSSSANLTDGIDGDIRRVAAATQGDTVDSGESGEFVPLDPNLKCPGCGKVFKKGRIQKYKRHVQICRM